MLGDVCSAIQRLPTLAVASGVAKPSGKIAGMGPVSDFWRGDLKGRAVAIKDFRTLDPQRLTEIKRVSKHSTCEARSQIKFPDHLEICTGMDETSRRQHPTIYLRYRHGPVPPCPLL